MSLTVEGGPDRVVPSSIYSGIVSMALMVYSIPNVLEDVDALVVFPGLGEDWRVHHAISWCHRRPTSMVLVAGINKNEKTWRSWDIHDTRKEFGVPPIGCILLYDSQMYAANTKEQAEWVYERVVSLDIQSLALFASPFHCLRVYLTLLKTFIAHGRSDIVLVPAPTPVSPSRLIPENQMSAWDLVPGEVQRIIDYQKKGDVATCEELAHYLKWLWEQPLVQKMEAVI